MESRRIESRPKSIGGLLVVKRRQATARMRHVDSKCRIFSKMYRRQRATFWKYVIIDLSRLDKGSRLGNTKSLTDHSKTIQDIRQTERVKPHAHHLQFSTR